MPSRLLKKGLVACGAVVGASFAYSIYANSVETAYLAKARSLVPQRSRNVPTREQQLARLDDQYDLVIIGAGATGSGIALDAITRGQFKNVLLIDRNDFASGTSSKSTKLVHGGVRYLEKAVFNLDYEQFNLVREALHERKVFLSIAPHLSASLPIMVPTYKYWEIPYFFAGTKAYDLLAGHRSIGNSFFMRASRVLTEFPALKSEGLKGALVYYDGTHNDSRMNVALCMTAAEFGATVLNYCEAVSFGKNEEGRIDSVVVRDVSPQAGGEKSTAFRTVKTKLVVNATGPFTDGIRRLDNPDVSNMVQPSSGAHLILPGHYSSSRYGLIDPNTSDGRVIFFLPWQSKTIVGTTDEPCPIEANPKATEDNVDFILNEVSHYIDAKRYPLSKKNVLASWSGIRPLVKDPDAENTESLVRNHIITISPSGLLTIAGGKWTTYREMAKETVDKAAELLGLPAGMCLTEVIPLVGGEDWFSTHFIELSNAYGIDDATAKHLSENYGDRADEVLQLSSLTGTRWPVKGKKLVQSELFIDGEVRYAVRHEYAVTAVDVIARRTRLSFLNVKGALEALPKVIDTMADELSWDSHRKQLEWDTALEFLHSMGLPDDVKFSRKDVESGKFLAWELEQS
ncbi:hypothetical protein CANCADRAFT_30577 [Tortispora caseinolytica NRRL Y-17796]|uniref:glycerol-3-phosphate dehydrogenase n=1 Tax=Tortispora caseinolytica NRRL Y-17796 TaxID=767744 RepID=A0A1E4TKZ4_9ASCO|nr:hypothetical protein CANCADRAFT_30577 [Tortispora caseinolytica NRRL Y-17796]